jgi:hypothetical protein
VKESRWLRWIGPGVIAILAIGSVASTAVGAGQRAWDARACPDAPGDRTTAARSTEPTTMDDLAQSAWFRLDPRLDRAGALRGQRLSLGLDGDRSSRVMGLPPESFAAGPFGRVVLVGADDGSRSRLEVIDVAAHCSWSAATEVDVVRRATIDPTGQTIYEMRVDRATRADLGIWSRPIDGSQPAVRILEPIDPDDRFGPTFSTEFAWDLSGGGLAIQSCGEMACRTRVVDPDGGMRTVVDPDLGTLVGLDGDRLVTYAACAGFPCPVVSTDLSSGARSTLADAAAVAILTATPDGSRLVHEVVTESGSSLRSVSLDGSSVADLGQLPAGLRLHATSEIAGTGTRVAPGWVLLTPEARIPDIGPNGQTQLRQVQDGTTVQFDEVAR